MNETNLQKYVQNKLLEAVEIIDAIHDSLEESAEKQRLSLACKILLEVINPPE